MAHKYKDEVGIALEAIRQSLVILARRKAAPRVKWKATESGIDELVTEFDVAVNKCVVRVVESAFPQDSIIGEELAPRLRKGATRQWLVDPIDGTRSFVQAVQGYSIMVSLVEDGDPQMSVIHDVVRCATVIAIKGHGIRLRSGDCTMPVQANRTYPNRLIWNPFASEELKDVVAHCLAVTGVVAVESTGLRALAMAEGRGCVYLSLPGSAKVWDTAPASVVLGEIGATYTDFEGNELRYGGDDYSHRRGCVATIAMDHEETLARLRPCLKREDAGSSDEA